MLHSSATSNSPSRGTLYFFGAASNTITGFYARNTGNGPTLNISARSDYNTVEQSTFIAENATAFNITDSSYNFISQIYTISNQHTLVFARANNNTLQKSTVITNGLAAGFWDAIIISNSNSNLLTQSFLSAPLGYTAVMIDAISGIWQAQLNTISSSTLISSRYAYFVKNYAWGNRLLDSTSDGIVFLSQGDGNTISRTTVTTASNFEPALHIAADNDSNTITQSYFHNPNYSAVVLLGFNNNIAQSTMTSANDATIRLTGSSNTISACYVEGSTAIYISNPAGTTIKSSVLVSSSPKTLSLIHI